VSLFRRIARDTRGSNALEYGLIVGLISLAIVAGATTAGVQLGNIFTSIGNQLATVAATISA
jgi:pilus assembly protein Flp/PilA